MTTTPPQNEWPTQAEDAPTMIVENGASVGAPVPPPIDPRRRAFNEIWPWLLVFVLLVLVAIGALWWYQDRHKTEDSSSTAVTQPTATTPIAAKIATPNVIGLKQSAAAAALTQAGLKPIPNTVKSLTAAGVVIAQRPLPGTRVERGSEVALDVAGGKPTVAVPDVNGMQARDAVTALHDAGFKTLVAFVPSTEPKGTIVAEAPAAGTKAPSGSTIRLNIAKGPQTNRQRKPTPTPATSVPASTRATPTTPVATASTPTNTAPAPKPTAVTVPDLTTQAILPATRTLEQGGLHTRVTLVESSQPAGRVISQTPTAQSKADKGDVVQLNVSLGPNPAPMTQVPDVTGNDVQQATQVLNEAGFTVQTVDRKVAGANQDATVVDEQPTGQAPQGFTIILIVGRTG